MIIGSSSDHSIIVCGDLNRLDISSLVSTHDLVPKVEDPTRGNALLDQILISSSLSSEYPVAEVGPPMFSGRRGSHGQVSLKPLQPCKVKNSHFKLFMIADSSISQNLFQNFKSVRFTKHISKMTSILKFRSSMRISHIVSLLSQEKVFECHHVTNLG